MNKSGEKKVVIYGVGNYAEIFYEVIKNAGYDVVFFLDQFSKKQIDGLPTHNIDSVTETSFDVFVSVSSPRKHPVIYEQLFRAGFSKIYNFIETLKMFPDIVEKSLLKQEKTYPMWYRSKSISLPSDEVFSELSSFFSDKKSKEILENIKSFRKNSIMDNYIYADYGNTQDFPEDIDLFENIDALRFVDCGSYNGDTMSDAVLFFSKKSKNIDSIIAFEPDPSNQRKILNKVNQFKEKISITIFPCAVYSENKIIAFDDSNGMTGSIRELAIENKKTISINVMSVSIDSTIFGTSPNYIKLDIEGAEKEALIGARKTIQNFKPILAISLYHRPEHLWEIPFLVKKIYGGKCKMYLRHYGEMGLETVLYCVSDSK